MTGGWQMALKRWDAADYPVRLPGHELRSEGAAVAVPGCVEGSCALASNDSPGRDSRMWMRTGGTGHALCSCGETSAHLPSANRRKQWHRDHKRQVADQTKAKG